MSDDDFIELEGEEENLSQQENQVEEPEEENKEEFSKKIQKRIDKLVYERNIERDARAKRDMELQELKREIETLKQIRQKDEEDKEGNDFENRFNDLLQQKRDALEIGDNDAVINIDKELFRMQRPVKAEKKEPEREHRQEPTPEYQDPRSEAQREWESRNAWVYKDHPDFDDTRLQQANRIFNELQEEGRNPYHPKTYEELDRRLNKKPEVRPSTGAPDRGEAVGSSKQTQFSSRDKSLMEGFGLDPNNPKHRAEWVKNFKESMA